MRRALVALGALGLLSGCFHDGVPPDAKLTCAGDQDCPPGLRCKAEVKLCVDPNGDSKPPALVGLAEVAPAVARVGLPVVIAFQVTEELFSDPEVRVGTRAAALDPAGSAGIRYRYVLDPDGSEPQDAAVQVSVTLMDSAGNEATVPAGSVRFDFLPPELDGTPEVKVVAPPRSLVDPVQAVGVGATVSVSLSFLEPLGAEPVVEAVREQAEDPAHPKPEEVLSFLRRSGGPTSYTYEHVLAATAELRPQGRYVLRTTARDGVGNEKRETFAQAAFEVDTVPPDDPDVETEGRIVFRREPWGTEASLGARRMALHGRPGAVGASQTVLVFTHDPHGELGRAVADGQGAVEVPLIYVDLPKVWVQAVDGAGNASAEVLVRDLEWVATMAGKTADGDANPHQFVSRSWMGHGLLGRIGPGYGAYPQSGEALARVDAVPAGGAPDAGGVAPTVVRQTGEPAWSARAAGAWPPYRCSFGEIALGGSPVAYDRAHEQAVLVSGNGKTWIYNGLSWRPAVVIDPEGDGDPAPRCGAQLVYDERRGVVVMVAGLGGIGEVWEWNGSSWRKGAEGFGPTARTYPAAAYDRERGEVVLFGGSPLLSGMRNDTWVWDGKAWSERKPAHRPPKRYAGAMVWDEATRSLLLFGGITTDDDYVQYRIGDLWRWDGTDWTEVRPASAADPWPPARALPSFIEDAGRGKVLLFGGRPAAHQEPDLLTWEWDGAGWTSRAVTPSPLDRTGEYHAPPVLKGRANSAAFYDPVRRKVVLYGGYLEWLDGTGEAQDLVVEELWEWDPAQASWENRTPLRDPATGLPVAPGKRLMAGMIYDTVGEQVLLFGGADGLQQANYTFGTPLDDLWGWDGVQWTRVPKAGSWPSGRGGCGMSFDPAKGKMLVFGGWNSLCDTWEYDPAAATWKVVAASAQPCVTTAMTSFDRGGTQQTLRFGGLKLEFTPDGSAVLTRSPQTALWSGAGWSVVAPPQSPSPRHMAAMAADGQGRVVLFGGEAATTVPEPEPFKGARRNDTWLWDGAAWTNPLPQDALLAPPGRPEARFGHSIVFDSDRGRALLSDGWGAGPMVDYWDWDGVEQVWRRRYPINPDSGQVPTPAFGRAAAYDARRRRVVYFGGQTATESSAEHWELDLGLGQRPGHVFHVSLAKSNLPVEASLTRVQVHAVAGGRGSGSTDGVALWGWLPQGWQTFAEQPAGTPDSLAALDAQIDDAARLARLKFQDGLHFAIVPRGTNASAPAEVVTDYVEATVRYRLPVDGR